MNLKGKFKHFFVYQTITDNHTEEKPIDVDFAAEMQPCAETDPPTAPDKLPTEPPDLSKPPRRQQGGYECKYCPFSTQNLNTFKEHVDANHPNVILNPLYLCAVCNFNTKKFDTLTEHNERCHPGESNFKFKRIKMNNQTILEQTIEGCSNSAVIYNTSSSIGGKGEELPPPSKPFTVKAVKPKLPLLDNKRTEFQLGKLASDLGKKPITALNVNGTVIIPESTLLKADGLSHIMPSLQPPLNYTQVGHPLQPEHLHHCALVYTGITSPCPGISNCIQTHCSQNLNGKSPNGECAYKTSISSFFLCV